MYGSRSSFSSALSEPESPFLRPWASAGSNADFFSPAPSTARSRAQADAFEAGLADELSRRLSQARVASRRDGISRPRMQP
jgi:hypothetical protein